MSLSRNVSSHSVRFSHGLLCVRTFGFDRITLSRIDAFPSSAFATSRTLFRDVETADLDMMHEVDWTGKKTWFVPWKNVCTGCFFHISSDGISFYIIFSYLALISNHVYFHNAVWHHRPRNPL